MLEYPYTHIVTHTQLFRVMVSHAFHLHPHYICAAHSLLFLFSFLFFGYPLADPLMTIHLLSIHTKSSF